MLRSGYFFISNKSLQKKYHSFEQNSSATNNNANTLFNMFSWCESITCTCIQKAGIDYYKISHFMNTKYVLQYLSALQ